MSSLAIGRDTNRYEIIDLLRGLAILLVVIRHVQIRIPFEQSQVFGSLPDLLFKALFVSGNEGVRIFFVISGFIITMTSLNRYADLRSVNMRQFYLFRFARIAPCLIGLLIILTALHFSGIKGYVINPNKFTYFEALFSALTFHLNWLEGASGYYLPPSWDVLWSLSVEEIFYLFFPIVCLMSRRKEVLYCLLIALIVIGPFNRYFLEGNKIWQSKAYLSCMDSIAMGCFFALISYKKAIPGTLIHVCSIAGASILMFVLMVKREAFFPVLSHAYLFKTLLSIGVGLLLIASVRQNLSRVFRVFLAPLLAYGKLSYEIYLTHSFVVLSGVSLFKKSNTSMDYVYLWLIGVIIVSGVLGYIVERHFSAPANAWIRQRVDSQSG